MRCCTGGGDRGDEARTRAGAYEFLALALSPPSTELADAVSCTPATFSLPALDMSAAIVEYHRLFVGPGCLPAPPYESVYRDGWRLMGETTLDVQRQYEAAGYGLDPSFTELPDHAAAELTFVSLLAEEEAKAWEAEDVPAALSWLERERAFLDEHLSRWLPALCDRILASAEVPFYRGLATTLREFVTLDTERVKALIGLLEGAAA